MGIKAWIADKLFSPPANGRDQYANMLRVLEHEAYVLDARFAHMSETTASVWRAGMAERMGRSLRDTLMPGEINGLVIVIDDSRAHGEIALVYPSGKTYAQEIFDITDCRC